VVAALGVDKKLAQALVRFSLGRETTLEEVSFAEKNVPRVVERAQRYQQDRSNV
jgi:cysteine sulfinate desulfinase/cysteine desulfurase-like protein